jgi:hypothetical protein
MGLFKLLEAYGVGLMAALSVGNLRYSLTLTVYPSLTYGSYISL